MYEGYRTPIGATHRVPEALASLEQFVAWRYVARQDAKPAKEPIDPSTGRRARTTDPATWGTLEDALERCRVDGLDGIGFVFTDRDEFAGVDLDGCRDPETGEIAPWALRIVERMDTYAEISPSGTGVKLIARGTLPGRGRRRGPVEMYDDGRYFTLTGEMLEGTGPVRDAREALAELYARLESEATEGRERAHIPIVEVSLTDQELLAKARSAGNGPRFGELFDDGEIGGGSHSEADLALCGLLAFWTGRDPARMDRLFRASALYRPKWDREDYRTRTLRQAAANTEQVYDRRPELDPRVERVIAEVRAAAFRDPWTGRGGPRRRWLLEASLDVARTFGKLSGEDVIFSTTNRGLSLRGGTKHKKVSGFLQRLEDEGWIRRLEKGRGESGSLYLIPRPARGDHRTGNIQNCVHNYGPTWPTPQTTSLLAKVRDHDPKDDSGDGEIVRPGALVSLVVERVMIHDSIAPEDLSTVMSRELRKLEPHIARALDCGLIRQEGEYLRALPERELQGVLLDLLRESGCDDREEDLRVRYQKDRNRYREYLSERRDAPRPSGVSDEDIDRYETFRAEEMRDARSPSAPPEPNEEYLDTPTVRHTPQEAVHDERGLVDLDDEDARTLLAILAHEEHFGEAYHFDRASAKGLFYSGPISGLWPDSEQHERLWPHYVRAGGRATAGIPPRSTKVWFPPHDALRRTVAREAA